MFLFGAENLITLIGFINLLRLQKEKERERERERERDHEGQRAMHFGFIIVRIFMDLCFYNKSNGMLVRQLELTKIPKTYRLKKRDVVLCRL